MTTSRSSRVALLCAGIILAGCALASDAQTETPTAPSVPSAQSAPAPQKVAQKTEKAAQKKVAKSDAAATHKVAIQVNQNDKAVMDLALNNAKNIHRLLQGRRARRSPSRSSPTARACTCCAPIRAR